MAGAYVKIKSTPVGVAMQLRVSSATDSRGIIALLAEYIMEWNFEDVAGAPLPITTEAIEANLEAPVISAIVTEWYKAALGITAPLDPPGADGTMTDSDMPMD